MCGGCHHILVIELTWKGGLAFEAAPEDGVAFTLDADAAHGGQGLGPTPSDALLSAAAACSAMDTLAILQKKGQKVTGYRVEVDAEKRTAGDWPRPIEKIAIRHIVSGENLDEAAVKRSLQLTDEKYCTIVSTLRSTSDVSLTYTIEDASR